MAASLIIGLLAVFCAWLPKHKGFRFGLELSFIIVFVFLAIRYEFGNDYTVYLDGFLETNRYSDFNLLDDIFGYEIGWKALCRLFKPIGFFGLTAVLALFNSFVYYRLIKKHVPVDYYWMGVLIYVFSSGLMLTQLSAMRQTVAINIFLLSADLIYQKKIVLYSIAIAVASLIHTSAVILFPLVALGYVNKRIDYKIGLMSTTLFSALFIFSKTFMPDVTQFISRRYQRYAIYEQAGAGELTTGLGIIFLSVLLLLTLYYDRFLKREDAIYFKLYILNSMFIPMGLAYVMFGRLAMFFAPSSILVYPLIASNIKNSLVKIGFMILVAAFTIYGFFRFFQSPIWRDAFETYRTIFAAPEFY